MQRFAFKMTLKPGCAAEYKKRHDEIWPEIVRLHSDAGISNYSIYLDEETDTLFACQERADDHTADALRRQPLIQKWWEYNKDLMQCHPDNSPVVTPLQEIFYMD